MHGRGHGEERGCRHENAVRTKWLRMKMIMKMSMAMMHGRRCDDANCDDDGDDDDDEDEDWG